MEKDQIIGTHAGFELSCRPGVGPWRMLRLRSLMWPRGPTRKKNHWFNWHLEDRRLGENLDYQRFDVNYPEVLQWVRTAVVEWMEVFGPPTLARQDWLRSGLTPKRVVKLLSVDAVDNTAVVAPLVWMPDVEGKKWWYFSVGTKGVDEAYRVDRIDVSPDRKRGEEIRASLIMAFAMCRPPWVLHDCDDELFAARLAEKLWPSAYATGLRTSIEQERMSG